MKLTLLWLCVRHHRAILQGWRTGRETYQLGRRRELLIERTSLTVAGPRTVRIYSDGLISAGGQQWLMPVELEAHLEQASERLAKSLRATLTLPRTLPGTGELWVAGWRYRYDGRPAALAPMLDVIDDALASRPG